MILGTERKVVFTTGKLKQVNPIRQELPYGSHTGYSSAA